MNENMYDAWDNGDRHEIRKQFARREEILKLASDIGMGWWLDDGKLERFAVLVAAAERERLLATDIHSCHANCERFACVQTRKAVEAEREACAKVLDEMADQMAADMEPSTAIAWVRNRAAHIRARGQE